MNCHGQIWNDATLLEPVRQSFYRNWPIPWQKIHRLPDFVFFNHAIHTHRGVDCSRCHGQVDRMARVYRVAPLNMAWCLECHRSPQRFVGKETVEKLHLNPPLYCTACHR
jgi:hypothetical protein